MSGHSENKNHIRHLMLYMFRRGLKATVATRKICEIYPEAISSNQCQRWFNRFRSGDIDLEDRPRSGRPGVVDNDVLLALVESDPKQSLEELAKQLGCHFTTVHHRLQELGKRYRAGVWVPHELTS